MGTYFNPYNSSANDDDYVEESTKSQSSAVAEENPAPSLTASQKVAEFTSQPWFKWTAGIVVFIIIITILVIFGTKK
ncbi:MAG: hypothetical protein J5642_02605 [Bacteroidales bacterium]|nr:hypothetical protein [Bacteroidales bacterium]